MSKSARTDIHRPGSPEFDPTQYDFHGVYDLGDETGTSPALRTVAVAGLLANGCTFEGSPHGADQCGHCGARLRYAALMTHRPTGVIMSVGETCLDERFLALSKVEFARLRARSGAKRDATIIERGRAIARMVAEHPELAALVDGSSALLPQSEFLRSISAQLRRRPLTPGQIAATLRTIRYLDTERKRSVERERMAVPSGRVRVTGRIKSVRVSTNREGAEFLAVVFRDDRGFTLWGPLPEGFHLADRPTSDLHGRRGAFTATLRRSDNDAHFGFFSRPTDVQRLAD